MQIEQMLGELETYHPSNKIDRMTIPLMLGFGGALGITAAFVVHLVLPQHVRFCRRRQQ